MRSKTSRSNCKKWLRRASSRSPHARGRRLLQASVRPDLGIAEEVEPIGYETEGTEEHHEGVGEGAQRRDAHGEGEGGVDQDHGPDGGGAPAERAVGEAPAESQHCEADGFWPGTFRCGHAEDEQAREQRGQDHSPYRTRRCDRPPQQATEDYLLAESSDERGEERRDQRRWPRSEESAGEGQRADE